MPRGLKGVQQVSREIESRRGGGGTSALWFRLDPGDEAIVRFLEEGDDVYWCYMHEVPVENRSFGRDVVCLDQDEDGTPCPGCEQGLQRKFKGFINVIWYDAPVFKRDSENKLVKENKKPIVVGRKTQTAIWGAGIRVFEDLDEKDTNYRGLRSCRFRIKRKGSGLDTKYSINPEDVSEPKQPFTDEEKKLDSEKYDLSEQTKPLSYDDLAKDIGGQRRQNGNGSEEAPKRSNPFMRNRA